MTRSFSRAALPGPAFPLALTALLAFSLFLCSLARATTIDEASDGDISSDIATPTLFALEVGSNLVTANSGTQGTTGGATNGSDAEFLTVVVPDGLVLDALNVVSRVGPGIQSFIAWNNGASLSGQGVGDIFDGALLQTGIDLFAGPSSSFTDQSLGVDQLGPGTYAFWIQETSGSVDYTLEFVVAPEPTTALLVAAGLLGVAMRRRAIG